MLIHQACILVVQSFSSDHKTHIIRSSVDYATRMAFQLMSIVCLKMNPLLAHTKLADMMLQCCGWLPPQFSLIFTSI